MQPKETGAAYDKIASHWVGDDFNQQNGLPQHHRALQFAVAAGRALDIGCGSSGRIIELLVEVGFEVEGIDVSAEMIRLAKERHPDVTFHHVDICQWPLTESYDFITAWDSLWHVPVADQPAVIEKVCGALAPSGVFIMTAGGLDGPGEVTNPCHGEPLYHATLGLPKLLRLLDANGCVCRHLEYDQFPEPHVYAIAQKL
ncbi:dTDP-3-amino-3,6-dideoxy-alpha-D-glucopyranose N,N-dimethyltransferase [Planctomycetes bacterium Pan216]|uniref:dTDP-3-amino-3,6-dideoxy-alpha-D-glucopyranose N,N-dimethyltransferase n=1 Tax=Kolteria novifilia TaxID=2527975 RepID=A0A518B5T0_9BACT|nr:dTDP-3-amino-3,6-dideoxy-alpha-D-glucopyranose N,N-dimethyltransferase [Planctomycetes bacterium Pan216]